MLRNVTISAFLNEVLSAKYHKNQEKIDIAITLQYCIGYIDYYSSLVVYSGGDGRRIFVLGEHRKNLLGRYTAAAERTPRQPR